MLTLIISTVAAVLAYAAYREGYRRGCGATARAMGSSTPTDLDAAYNKGWLEGTRDGVDTHHATLIGIAERTLADSFPTSLGGRAIVRALGGTVPPITRKRTEEPEVGRE